ncbi:unnamed protein product [Anisakis simplex]|uniref:Nose resistant to fluoxetine protein 5 (inferred by orthology to a C. elegans protein) n=1 Tax=Anisakis simplex TaxID=6269 RepID=A0A0M3J2D8_ANISI|nr:unnamed protein product [Anisakis simplex]
MSCCSPNFVTNILISLLISSFAIAFEVSGDEVVLSPYKEPTTPEPISLTLANDDPIEISSFSVSDGDDVPAGIYFRVSQKGIDYITSLAAEALPQLLDKLVLPTVDNPQIKISKMTIQKFVKPTIEAKFLDGLGVRAHVHLPEVMVSAIYDASTFFTTYTGKFKADVENLTVTMEVYVSRNETAKINIIEVGRRFDLL